MNPTYLITGGTATTPEILASLKKAEGFPLSHLEFIDRLSRKARRRGKPFPHPSMRLNYPTAPWAIEQRKARLKYWRGVLARAKTASWRAVS